MAGGIVDVAALDAAGALLPTPKTDRAEATTAVPVRLAVAASAAAAPTRAFTGDEPIGILHGSGPEWRGAP